MLLKAGGFADPDVQNHVDQHDGKDAGRLDALQGEQIERLALADAGAGGDEGRPVQGLAVCVDDRAGGAAQRAGPLRCSLELLFRLRESDIDQNDRPVGPGYGDLRWHRAAAAAATAAAATTGQLLLLLLLLLLFLVVGLAVAVAGTVELHDEEGAEEDEGHGHERGEELAAGPAAPAVFEVLPQHRRRRGCVADGDAPLPRRPGEKPLPRRLAQPEQGPCWVALPGEHQGVLRVKGDEGDAAALARGLELVGPVGIDPLGLLH